MDSYANKFLQLLKSRKFWAAVVTVLVVIFGNRAGIDQATLNQAVAVVITYILGVALEDGLSRRQR